MVYPSYRYSYDGPILQFDKIISPRWTGETYATTEAKARSNLTFRYKRDHGLDSNAKITLPGKIERVE